MMTTENQTQKKYPTHMAYFTKNKGDAENEELVKAGVAWSHANGEGLSLSLRILGVSIPVVIFKNKPKPE